MFGKVGWDGDAEGDDEVFEHALAGGATLAHQLHFLARLCAWGNLEFEFACRC